MTSATNNKSQQINARFPHDVVSEMDSLLSKDESKAQFIITAVRGEIARRKAATTGPENVQLELNKALEAMATIESLGEQAQSSLRVIVRLAQDEIQRHQRK
ncbi:YlcI/YnfO family protein [Phytobacter sp. V91]|uniref:YlcI/YnfO family protein n=1 Tax=Phytobacter sp. V91 TaxID=3369425 RepID=UPI003F5E67A6